MTEDKERLKASREIGKALRAIKTIQTLYRITGGLAIAVAAIALKADTTTIGAIAAAAATMLFIGAHQVREQPRPWSVGMAVVISLMVGAMISGARNVTVDTVVGAATAIALWCVLPLAFRAQGLMDRYPDLYIAEKWKGRRSAAPASSRAKDIHAETRRQKRASLKKLAAFLGAFAVFVAVVIFLKNRKEDTPVDEPPIPVFGSRAEDFRRVWNEGEWKDVEEFLPPAHRALPRSSAS